MTETSPSYQESISPDFTDPKNALEKILQDPVQAEKYRQLCFYTFSQQDPDSTVTTIITETKPYGIDTKAENGLHTTKIGTDQSFCSESLLAGLLSVGMTPEKLNQAGRNYNSPVTVPYWNQNGSINLIVFSKRIDACFAAKAITNSLQ